MSVVLAYLQIDQLMTLEVELNKNPTPTTLVREGIAQEINMTDARSEEQISVTLISCAILSLANVTGVGFLLNSTSSVPCWFRVTYGRSWAVDAERVWAFVVDVDGEVR
ncbi:uncharacterized protein RHO25_012380 [Cercospora beticola]|uniref:Uncharacterized protein n=1 Tax=Cercospora beticola TaxID=122368 RepID=A0ABZ0P740_CERBT|nr:hypothetical protein RHO25_012380 [Cercospora beticola]